MLVFRCTQKLLKKKPGPVTEQTDSLVPVLGSWHANLIHVGHSPVVICTNDRSLLPVLIRGRDFPNLIGEFRERLARRLERMGIAKDAIYAELAAMETVQIGPSNSKSVLGSMNDLAYGLKSQVGYRYDLSQLDELEDLLSQTLMGALKYKCPVEVAAEAFGLKLDPASLREFYPEPQITNAQISLSSHAAREEDSDSLPADLLHVFNETRQAIADQRYKDALSILMSGLDQSYNSTELDGVALRSHFLGLLWILNFNLRKTDGANWESKIQKVPAKEMQCSFCSRTYADVSRLISGAESNICEECVGICNQILFDVD